MPSNSGLYDDDSSDRESLSNELSPTDGYFHRRPSHPQDVLVPDPSQNADESDKAREAREESGARHSSEAGAAERRPSQYSPQSPPSRRRLDPAFEDDRASENTPLIPSAPPAYSAATAGSSYQPPVPQDTGRETERSRDYNTMGRQDVFLSNGSPENMGGSQPRDNDRVEGGWMHRFRAYFYGCFGSVGKFLLLFLALVIGIGFIADAIMSVHGRHDSTKKPVDGPIDKTPNIPGHLPQSCPGGVYEAKANFVFDNPSEFAFIELVHDEGYASQRTYSAVRVSGEIHLRRAVEDAAQSITVDISLHYSDPDLRSLITWKQGPYFVTFNSPRHILKDSNASYRPCIYIVTTMWIAPGVSLDAYSIDTQSLSVTFHDGLSFKVDGGIGISALLGPIIMPKYRSVGTHIDYRRMHAEVQAGSVKGSFTLDDQLTIITQSGAIDVDIDVHEVSGRSTAPAVLHLESASGSIHASMPALTRPYLHIPNREYTIGAYSISGGLYVRLIHGLHTYLRTSSGSIQAILSPFGSLDVESTIESKSDSGSTDISVLSSLSYTGIPIRNLFGSFVASTGNLRLQFPAEWEGQLNGKAMSGSFKLLWKGMQIVQDSKEGYLWNVFKAVKGRGKGVLYFENTSGSTVIIGTQKSSEKVPNPGSSGNWGKDDEPPKVDPPGMGGPPVRWPGYDDEWA